MKIFALPQKSYLAITICIFLQLVIAYIIFSHDYFSFPVLIATFLISAFITDLVTGIGHFSFDYIWPDWFPIMGPISVEFREHHEAPGLDPSDIFVNITLGSYASMPLSILALIYNHFENQDMTAFFIFCLLSFASLWMIGFHQIHSYAHMGLQLSAKEFNSSVHNISQLPVEQQRAEAKKIFASVEIPQFVRFLQYSRIFLRPEVHWLHHISFESDFSSLNGWSDPLMNLIYRPLARKRKKP